MSYPSKLLAPLMGFCFLLLVNGCGTSRGENQHPHEQQASPPAPVSASLADYPVQIALASLGHSFQETATQLEITQRPTGGELADSALVTIEASGLQDDSIAAEKYLFTMSYRNSKWQIDHLLKTYRCWPGRGHQIFSTQQCN